MWSLNCICKCSFDKLISNCSRELRSKLSKPLMSKMPSKRSFDDCAAPSWTPSPTEPSAGAPTAAALSVSVLSCVFMRRINHSKRYLYNILLSPSRTAFAWSTLSGVSVTSLPATTFRHNMQRPSSRGSTCNSSPARTSGVASLSKALSSSASKARFPKVSTPATMEKICSCSLSLNPRAEKAPCKSLKHSASSMPGAATSELCKYTYWSIGAKPRLCSSGEVLALRSWLKMWKPRSPGAWLQTRVTSNK
mmetsp:Transcript_55154/g.159685  ORF Transcript_55154/g.159685 Transcript_55154/m.159685 type:complete len:250 (-) Transcript_55154:673-1422(-)